MGFFSRKDKIVDLTEGYTQRRARTREGSKVASSGSSPAQTQEDSQGGFFNFFGNSNTPSSSSSSGIASLTDSNTSETLNADEKRRRLAKRLKDMTDRIEEQSNQIYILQQRIEVLEKKTNASQYE